MSDRIASISQISEVVGTYRYFYYLANEMAFKSISDERAINSVRYSVATVIYSYTTIETLINHHLHSKDNTPLEGLTKSLSSKIERMNNFDKLELSYNLSSNISNLSKFSMGVEPIQSINILRELRNYLIHNMPVQEISFKANADIEEYEIELAKKVKGKFDFNTDILLSSLFLYRCFSPGCARWSFELVDTTLNWF